MKSRKAPSTPFAVGDRVERRAARKVEPHAFDRGVIIAIEFSSVGLRSARVRFDDGAVTLCHTMELRRAK